MKMINSASVDITYQCNYRCKHCFNSSGVNGKPGVELSDQELSRIFMSIAELGADSICFCGGEPLIRKDFILKTIPKIKSVNSEITISMVSNGSLFERGDAKKLFEKGMDRVQISIDGAYASTHDWQREHGSFQVAMSTINDLVSNGIATVIAFTPSKRNKDELCELIDLAVKLGCSEVRVQPTMILGRAKENSSEYALTYRDYMSIKHLIDKKNTQYINSGFSCTWGDPISHLKMAKTHLFYHLTISAYGDLLASPYLPISFGNIRNASLKDYLNKGVLSVLQTNPLVRYLVKNIDSVYTLDVSTLGLPELHVDEMIDLDILSPEYEKKTEDLIKIISAL